MSSLSGSICVCVCVCWRRRRQPRDCAYKHFQASRCEKPLAPSLRPQEWKRKRESERKKREGGVGSERCSSVRSFRPFMRASKRKIRKRWSVKSRRLWFTHTAARARPNPIVFAERSGVKLEREYTANPWGWPWSWPLTFNLWSAASEATKKNSLQEIHQFILI